MRKMHFIGLLLFAAFMVFVWTLPSQLAGFPFWISYNVIDAQAFAATGTLSVVMAPLTILLVWLLHFLIGWQNMMGWATVSAAVMALSILPLWWSVRRLFDARVAWLTVVVFSFMPLYWVEAVRLEGYSFAFPFFFLGFALFLQFYKQHRLLAITLAGLCFGAALAAHHAFISLLPWMVCAYLWQQRSRWKRAMLDAALYCGTAYIAFVLPLLPNALQDDMTLSQRIAIFLPSVESHYTGVTHLYPDEYTYLFLRDEFEQRLLAQNEQASFLARQSDRHYRINFGVEDVGFWGELFNGFWLFLNNLPLLFLQETIGGVFLWLFILPGAVTLFLRRRRLFLQMVGLWLSMEIVVRFVLHFSRDHLMDVGWILALLAAVGVVSVGTAVHAHSKKISVTALSLFMIVVISAQLVQANRKLFARLYDKSSVPDSYAAQIALAHVPEDAVIASPKEAYGLFLLTQRKPVFIHNDTVDHLASQVRLHEPIEYYGITHIIGYTNDRANAILAASPGVQIISYDRESMDVQVTPFIELLLHMVR